LSQPIYMQQRHSACRKSVCLKLVSSRETPSPSPAQPRPGSVRRKRNPGQEVVRAKNNPLKSTGGLVILHGNLSPEGCVIKVAGNNTQTFRGPARVFDGEEAAFAAVNNSQIKAGDVVVIVMKARAADPACAKCSRSPRP